MNKYTHLDGSFSLSGYVKEQMEELDRARQLEELYHDKEWVEYMEAFIKGTYKEIDENGDDRS